MKFTRPLAPGSQPLYRQLYRTFRQAIVSGALRSGEKLPSTRELAEQIGISRTVVLLAYDHLLAEGFAVARRGSGTYVSAILPPPRHAGRARVSALKARRSLPDTAGIAQ